MNEQLEYAVETLTANLSFSNLAKARDSLTTKYRNPSRHDKLTTFMETDLERLSYLVTRMPATYAVIDQILNEVLIRNPHLQINSLLDLGSGPGTAYFAAVNIFEGCNKISLIEQDGGLIKLGKSLESLCKLETTANWMQGDITNLPELSTHDLVTISYAMNELKPEDRLEAITKGFNAASKVLVIIEPGTMAGFEIIREVRAELIALGAHPIAPCPHAMKCPMPDNDWCHFSKRVSRTKVHRHLKEGTLGYEDEKFSYIAVSKSEVVLPDARIIRHPDKHSGHMSLKLCTKEGELSSKTISKRDGPLYKQARKLDWGDSL